MSTSPFILLEASSRLLRFASKFSMDAISDQVLMSIESTLGEISKKAEPAFSEKGYGDRIKAYFSIISSSLGKRDFSGVNKGFLFLVSTLKKVKGTEGIRKELSDLRLHIAGGMGLPVEREQKERVAFFSARIASVVRRLNYAAALSSVEYGLL